LGDWQVVTPLQAWLGQWSALLSAIPEGVVVTATALPIAIAILSKRLIVLLASTLLALASLCVLVAPSNLASTIAGGFYLISLTIALSGIVIIRKMRAVWDKNVNLEVDMNRLRQEVRELSQAEQRRLLRKLNERSVTIVPQPGDPSAQSNGGVTDPNPSTKRAMRRRRVARDAPTQET
jgi:hypothetical protein